MNAVRRARPLALAACLVLGSLLAGCTTAATAAPRCEAGQRLAIVAQSAPGAAYLPCIDELPPGWQFESFEVDDDGARFSLVSDRADRPVDVWLSSSCDVGQATPVAPVTRASAPTSGWPRSRRGTPGGSTTCTPGVA